MGFLSACISALFGSSKDLLSKVLSGRVSPTVSAFASFAYTLPLYALVLGILWLLGLETFAVGEGFWLLVLLRALTDTGAETFKMMAFKDADVSTVSILLALTPAFLLIASPWVTGDPLTTTGIIATLIVVAGSMLAIQSGEPGKYANAKAGAMFAVLSAFLFCLNSCFDRLAALNGSPTLAAATMTGLSSVFLAPFVLRGGGSAAGLRQEAGLFSARAGCEVGFMVGKLYALQYLQAPYVLALQRLSLVFSIIGGSLFFGERHLPKRLVAGALNILGGLIIVLGL
jgi:drug/metabolite transporter (DMT)-like permease